MNEEAICKTCSSSPQKHLPVISHLYRVTRACDLETRVMASWPTSASWIQHLTLWRVFLCCFLLLPSYFVTLTCGIKSVALDLHVTQNIRRWLEATRIIFCFSWIVNVRFLNSLQLQCQVQWIFFCLTWQNKYIFNPRYISSHETYMWLMMSDLNKTEDPSVQAAG